MMTFNRLGARCSVAAITRPAAGYPAVMHPYEPGESEDPLTFDDDSYRGDPDAGTRAPAGAEIDFEEDAVPFEDDAVADERPADGD
jgi:hypothetical protein